MKNVRPSQLKKAIFLEEEEFFDILNEIFGKDENEDDINLDISSEGISISYPKSELSFEEIHAGLEKYFDVSKVISIHADDCMWVGIWIIYEN